MGGSLGNRSTADNQYRNSNKNWKRELEPLNKQNKMLFSMTKPSGSCRELKKIKKIRSKASKKHEYSISNISISDYDSSLSNDNKKDERRHPD